MPSMSLDALLLADLIGEKLRGGVILTWLMRNCVSTAFQGEELVFAFSADEGF